MLDRAENDFSWSRWNSRSDAVAEIDAIIAQIEGPDTVKLMPIEMLFAPTGSLQEVSIESGWADDFLALAARFDTAISDL
ncbi:hypothetical protein [Brevundimonas sp.]